MTIIDGGLTGENRPDLIAERRGRRRYLGLLLPPLLVLLVLFIYPVLGLLWMSVDGSEFGLGQYRELFSEPMYLTVFLLTFKIAAQTTLICLVLGYPLAYVITNLPRRLQAIALTCVVLPFFISLIVRTYAWMVILGRRGLLNSVLEAMPFNIGSIQLLYTEAGNLIGMSYAMLPFMVLTSYTVMRAIDERYTQAGYSLGANGLQNFFRVFLPLSLPGVFGGTILVFIMSLGYFVTPRLMGGPSTLMIAMLIEHEVELTLNWAFASALATILLAITLVGFVAYARLVKLETIFEARR